MEIWKPVKDYEGLYEVSDLGRVKSLNYNRTNNSAIMKLGVNGRGYYTVCLSKNKKVSSKRIHVLVAESFLNHKPDGSMNYVVDHINDDILDNRVENLQVTTQRNNACKTQGRYSSKYKGVTWNKSTKRWIALIRIDNKSEYLGSFLFEDDACLAYQNKLKTI